MRSGLTSYKLTAPYYLFFPFSCHLEIAPEWKKELHHWAMAGGRLLVLFKWNGEERREIGSCYNSSNRLFLEKKLCFENPPSTLQYSPIVTELVPDKGGQRSLHIRLKCTFFKYLYLLISFIWRAFKCLLYSLKKSRQINWHGGQLPWIVTFARLSSRGFILQLSAGSVWAWKAWNKS